MVFATVIIARILIQPGIWRGAACKSWSHDNSKAGARQQSPEIARHCKRKINRTAC
jgi:hypothetical protein